MIVDGLEYVSTGVACERLDVHPDTLRNWYAPRTGTPRVRVLRDPTGRPVRNHRQLMLCWADVVEAEHLTRTTARRPRL